MPRSSRRKNLLRALQRRAKAIIFLRSRVRTGSRRYKRLSRQFGNVAHLLGACLATRYLSPRTRAVPKTDAMREFSLWRQDEEDFKAQFLKPDPNIKKQAPTFDVHPLAGMVRWLRVAGHGDGVGDSEAAGMTPLPVASVLDQDRLMGALLPGASWSSRFFGLAVDFGAVRAYVVTLFTLAFGIYSILRGLGVTFTVESACPMVGR
ncbi:hypothetical protein DFJ74DRAFT_701515 [Hyaloraphidium curvatum]|nr:hypothetical protein DFJ74DRAFT_701515 [Hyaloraphidium curvatum]